jgi:hypothetical protein
VKVLLPIGLVTYTIAYNLDTPSYTPRLSGLTRGQSPSKLSPTWEKPSNIAHNCPWTLKKVRRTSSPLPSYHYQGRTDNCLAARKTIGLRRHTSALVHCGYLLLVIHRLRDGPQSENNLLALTWFCSTPKPIFPPHTCLNR